MSAKIFYQEDMCQISKVGIEYGRGKENGKNFLSGRL